MPDGDKKYYWLKLKKDFFKRHDIQIIEAMPNGKDYVLFYLKLLVESVDHEGMLRFNDTLPYNEDMLSTITHTNIDIVRSAMKLLVSLNMIDVMEDETIYMAEVEKMLGSEGWSARRVRRFRERDNQKKEVKALPCNTQVTNGNAPVTCGNVELEIEKELEIDKVKTSCASKSMHWTENGKKSPPTLDEVKAYCQERKNRVDPEQWFDFYTAKNWYIGKNKMKDWKAAVRTWERNRDGSRSTPSGQSPVEAAGYRYVTAEDDSI